jgi:hypothetical protein
MQREFLLFSDCLLWLAPIESHSWDWDWSWSGSGISYSTPPPPNMVKKHGSNDDKFIYKGRVELVDLEVIVGSALEDERRFEVLSPEVSFVVYAGKNYLSYISMFFKN